ncbi:MAG TPA: VOC family protein [Candidatus Angelobacter sp.]
MRNIFGLLLWALLFLGLSSGQSKSGESKQNMTVRRITPVLYVKEIEPCVAFWVERLGFKKTAEVPDGDRLGFVILQKDGLEIMYQSLASAEKDAPAAAKEINGGRTFLYIEVDKLQTIIDAMKNANVVIPLRTTFYGAKEIGVKDPAGHVIVFAEMVAAPPH